MQSSPSVQDSSIARAATRLRWAVFAVMAAMTVVYAAARFGWQFGAVHVAYRGHPGAPDGARWIGDATMLLLLVALFELTRMLRLIGAGELFSVTVVRSFRRFALWLLLMGVFALLAPIILGMLQPAAGHAVRLIIDFRQVLTLGITLLLFLLARLLEHARRLDEEVREFV